MPCDVALELEPLVAPELAPDRVVDVSFVLDRERLRSRLRRLVRLAEVLPRLGHGGELLRVPFGEEDVQVDDPEVLAERGHPAREVTRACAGRGRSGRAA